MSVREYIERILAGEADKLPDDFIHPDLVVPGAHIPNDICYSLDALPVPSGKVAAAAQELASSANNAVNAGNNGNTANTAPSLLTDAELRQKLLRAMAEKCNLREDQMSNVLLQIQKLVSELPAEELRVFRRTFGSIM